MIKPLFLTPLLVISTVAFMVVAFTVQSANANPARDAIIAQFAAAAGGKALSADRGKALFRGTHAGGKPGTPSCTTCHTKNLRSTGKTRVGKVIQPMAVSANPDRFTDPAKVAKWFRRNCRTVLGRECTATEKGDILTYLSSI